MGREVADLVRGLQRAVRELPEETWTLTSPLQASPAPLRRAAPGALQALAAIKEKVAACRKCPLGSTRLNPAFGVGPSDAEVMFIGEGPGFEEDHRGEPFVGRAGKLLDKIIASIGLSREAVYIANVVKCHPMLRPHEPESRGNDRPPTPEEMAACRSYLEGQIEAIRPKALVTLGATAAKGLLATASGISSIRGRWQEISVGSLTFPVLPTYHPAALLRNPALKRDVWNDMKALRKFLETSK